MYADHFMKRAIAISRTALDKAGAQPFGAVVVKDGEIIGEGLNHVMAKHDPTSHGEVEAIREACRRLDCVDLSGCELYSSCEPCTICVATMAAAGITRLYYAATLDQAYGVLSAVPPGRRHPIDNALMRQEAGRPVEARAMRAEQHHDGEALQVMRDWTRG